MSVYFSIPSARPPDEALPVLHEWQKKGYRVIVQRDLGEPSLAGIDCIHRSYAGYPEAINFLCRGIIRNDPKAEWIVIAGDDTLPDPNKSAEEIGRECSQHFEDEYWRRANGVGTLDSDQRESVQTFGVMQPTGDPWADSQGRIIDRIAGSPWIGREFARRMYKGRGPLWEGFFHMFEDEHLMAVAEKLGVFWQRPDLTHHHNHWCRPKPGQKMGHINQLPGFHEKSNSKEEWIKAKAEFDRLKAGGFAEALDLLP